MKADHKLIKRKISIAKGQLDGILKMIDDDNYCMEISNQILAVIALLKNANTEIISAHLAHCVKDANSEELDSKIEEIKTLLKRMN